MKRCLKFFIVILFSTILFTLSANFVYADATIQRISGETRYDTAASIAKEGWPDGSNYAILAYGGNFPDALASAPLASKYNAPILLTEKSSLSAVTQEALTMLGTQNVIIVGGTGAVSGTVENQLKSMGLTVTRIFGSDRFSTSVEIAKKINTDSGKLIIAPGSDFPNALSVSSYAGEYKIPIILVDKNTVSSDLKEYLSGHDITHTYLIGTVDEISDSIKTVLPNPTRIQGSDKYGTNLAVLKAFDADYNFETTFLATGTGFADALAGSAYAAKIGSPIILTGKSADSRIINYFADKIPNIGQLNILGGEAAVSTSLANSYLGFESSVLTAKEIFSRVSHSVVYIETYDSAGNSVACGSGFIVDSANGKVVTNYHVINGAQSAKVKISTGAIYTVEKVLGYDQAADIAILKINGFGLKAVSIGDSETVETGDKIYAIGNPLGLENTMSDGLISSKSRVVDGTSYIQISAPISHGSSGGVLLNEQGKVIGITSAGIDDGQNLNFAIPINALKPMLTQDINKTLADIVRNSSNTTISPSMSYSDFANYLQLKYSYYPIGNNVISFSNVKIQIFADGSICFTLNMKVSDDRNWIAAGASDISQLNQYLTAIIQDAEQKLPEMMNKIMISVWVNDIVSYYPASFYQPKDITYAGSGLWGILHCRAYAIDYSGFPIVTLEPYGI